MKRPHCPRCTGWIVLDEEVNELHGVILFLRCMLCGHRMYRGGMQPAAPEKPKSEKWLKHLLLREKYKCKK